jgi:glucose-6-phosphate dehydrogenase assembly protein OpcA
VKVALEKVERELAVLWEDEAKKTQRSRVALMTLAALVSETRLLGRAKDVLASVARAMPCRTIAATWGSGDPTIDCDVELHRNPARKDEACGDAIVLEAKGSARDWLPENFDRLALSDVPYCLWWVGDLPDYDKLFDEAVQHVDVVVVNSAEMDLRDLEKLAGIVRASKGTYALLDLTWVRLRGLQDLVARFFDDPTTRPFLDGLKSIKITYSPRANESDVASTRVGLFLGWMASALGFATDSAKWTRDATGGELRVERRGKPIVVKVDRATMEGAHEGTITKIVLSCDGPGGEGRFELERESLKTVRWTIDAPGVLLPEQKLALSGHDERDLLARQLERPKHDALFESSIDAAFRLVQPIAPRLSAPPVRVP